MKALRERFRQIYPDKFFLSYSIPELEAYLRQRAWLGEVEKILSVEKPGEGNMNFVLRVQTAEWSAIIKQARPWVEKYPSIDAPVIRNEVEGMFLKAVNSDAKLTKFAPKLLGDDPDNFILLIEDLGEGMDYSSLYEQGNVIDRTDLGSLMGYLSKLHRLDCSSFPVNEAMRRLNHEHIFNFPFNESNGFNLDDVQVGLQAASLPYKRDHTLKSAIFKLGELYLSEGPVLIHGDYYPGSWLQTQSGLKVIDAEFSFMGYAEFDLGVLLAHLVLSQHNDQLIQHFMDGYDPLPGFNHGLMKAFAGIEILRRLLGVAQLPLSMSLSEKGEAMVRGASWIHHF